MTFDDLGTRLFAENHPNPNPDSSERGRLVLMTVMSAGTKV